MKTNPIKRLALLLCLALLCALFAGCQSSEAARTDELLSSLDVNVPDEEAVEAAREAFDALSEKERESLENAAALLEAEASLRAREVDELIAGLGEITLDSGEAIEKARSAYDALDADALSRVTALDALTEAEAQFHRLRVEDAAAKIDALIDGVGEVTLESGEAIAAARAALEAADSEVLAAVKGAPALEQAEEAFHRLEVEKAAVDFDAMVADLGEVTLESEADVRAARETYDALSEEVRAEVGSLETLEAAEERLVYLGNKARADEFDASLPALDAVTLENEADIAALRKAYEALPAEVRELSAAGEMLDKAEAALLGLHDKAAAAEIKKLSDAKKYDEAIKYGEDYLGDRDLREVKGGVVKACLNAYTAKANALIKAKKYEEAYLLIQTCKANYAGSGADFTALDKASATLKKAIAEPKNGQVFSSKAKGGYCTLTIKAGDTPVFIKVVSNSDPKNTVTMYVRANKSATVHVKNGKYSLRYATGDKWFGTGDLFGSDTRYYSADTTLDFTTSRSGNYINYRTITITLYSVAGGNLSTSRIDGNNF